MSSPLRLTSRGLVGRLAMLFAVALLVRAAAAVVLEQRNRQQGREHTFADTELYWKLALAIAAGEPYDDGRRQVLRTPGYPAFLACSIRLLGPSFTAARHAQAAVGALSCVLLFFLVRKLLGLRTAWIAAWIAAGYPFAVFLSAVLLSETAFTAALLAQLICLAQWVDTAAHSPGRRKKIVWSMLSGLCGAAATLLRPSWILATPLAAVTVFYFSSPPYEGGGPALSRPGSRIGALGGFKPACVMVLAFLLAMAPWWIRNWRVTGHVVLTTLWVGASLFDGLNEHATGASNMEFMNQPARYGLDPGLLSLTEWEQDRYLRRAAWEFARTQPDRVLELAAVKFVRFWNPMPNAPQWRSWPWQLAGLATCVPVFLLAIAGGWTLRRRPAVLGLLAGPVLYFCATSLVFVSSIRYREAAMLPVLGLVAAALEKRSTRLRRLGP